ncbi:MAG: thiamine diphosphokinase [Bacteroidota bacterium]|nr:thiamine diphosphokinase [Candidatus Kapabacteria bacterium]MCX7937167.1 thiamine diphosphokinase [Chlorobiota bacterium]MDW8075244.1 thiamine diphosphokinase [Bacteroidota bacterium]
MRALVSLSGVLPASGELQRLRYDTVIAADGSAWQLLERGIVPHVIIGDLDSLHSIPNAAAAFRGSHIVHLSDQDSTDFEKALRFGIEHGVGEFIVVGMNGGELEHTLNNWSIFLRYSQQLPLEVFDAGRIGRAVNSSLVLRTTPGEIISLIPQPRARLTTRGLVWELSDEILELGTREGARNQAYGDRIEIYIHEGSVLVFFDAFSPRRADGKQE